MADMICPVCTIWFCTDSHCAKVLSNREYHRNYTIKHDRLEYFRERYRNNRAKMKAQSLAAYYARKEVRLSR